jgi:tetratricopeptide (TPR) repeat protein
MDTNTSEEIFFGELLKQFRKRMNLNQTQLGKQIGVSRTTVSLWEIGDYKPETDRVVYDIAKVLRLTSQEKQELYEAYNVTALVTAFHNPPFEQNSYFTGRSSQLDHLHSLLKVGKKVALTQAISGLGGIGKTQLALEYAYRYQQSYHDIFWVNAETEEAWMTSYVKFADLLHLPEYAKADQNKAKDAVYRWLQKHSNWLLILDNVEDLSLLRQFVPVKRTGAVLLTTRRAVTEPVAQAFELELLPENDAILFLLKRTKVLAVDQFLAAASEHDIEAARAITRLLGHLPLALDQAGAYILEAPCSFAEYGELFQTCRSKLLQRRIAEDMLPATDHPESVMATFILNLRQVQQRNPAAGELFRLCAFLAPDTIPEEIITEGASLLGEVLAPVAWDALRFYKAIETLRAYSLVQRDPQGKTLSIHRMTQAVRQDTMKEEEQRRWVERALRVVSAAFPKVEQKNWQECEQLLPHIERVVQHLERLGMMNEEAGLLVSEAAMYLRDRSRYPEAESLLHLTLHALERRFGPEHPSMISPLNTLASLYMYMGEYKKAKALCERVLQLYEQQPERPRKDIPLHILGTCLIEQKNYGQDVESLLRGALQIRQQALGQMHPEVATTLNALAVLYTCQGEYEKAEGAYKEAQPIYEQHGEYLKLAYVLCNLGELYLNQGNYTDSGPLFRQAQEMCEQQLEPGHHGMAVPLNGLARWHFEQGNYTEAEHLYQQTLQILEQAVGQEHPETANVIHDLARLRERQGEKGQPEG